MKQKLALRVGKIAPFSKNKLGFSDIFIIEPEDPEKKAQGSLYFVIEIATPSPKAQEVAQLIINTIEEEYYQQTEKTADESFELALKKVNDVLGDLVEDGEISWLGKLNVIGGVLKGNELILTATGNAEAYLIREENFIKISEGLYTLSQKPDPLKTFENITLGEVLKDDVIILTTPGLLNYFSPHQLKKIFKENSAHKAAQLIEEELKKENAILPSLLILEFKTEEEISLAIPEEPLPEKTLPKKEIKFDFDKEKAEKVFLFLKEKFFPFVKEIIIFALNFLKKAVVFIGGLIFAALGFLGQLFKKGFDFLVFKLKNLKNQKTLPSLKTAPSYSQFSQPKTANFQKFNFKKVFSFDFSKIKKQIFKLKRYLNAFWADIRSLKLKDFKDRSFKTYLLLFVVSLILFTLALGITAIKKKQIATLRHYEDIYKEAELKTTKAEAALIPQDEIGKKQAETLIDEVLPLIEELRKTNYKKNEVDLLAQKIEKIQDQIENVVRVSPSLLIDFASLQAQDLLGVFKIENDFYLVDKNKANIFRYDPQESKGELVLTKEEGGFNSAHVFSDKLLLLRNQELLQFDPKLGDLEAVPLLLGAEVKPAIDMDSYNNYLYLLSPQENQIYRSANTLAGFGKFLPYIRTSQNFDLKDARSLAISNFVYVLKGDGQILKMAGGNILKFEIKGLKKPLKNPTLIYTAPSLDKLYIADPENQRLVVLSQDGKFIKQFKSEALSSISGLLVEEKTEKIYFISQNKLFSFSQ